MTLLAALALWPASAVGQAPPLDLLVVMTGSGSVERFDTRTGAWRGTFLRGLPNPHSIAWSPDGRLCVSGGAIGGRGYVRAFDGRTGRPLGDLVTVPDGRPGALRRATGIAWHEGDLYVADCDEGCVKRYDGRTGAFQGIVARGSPGGITQVRFHEGALVLADFHANAIRRYGRGDGPGGAILASRPGFAPWSVAFDPRGALLWGGSGERILRTANGETQEWAGSDGSVRTPLALEFAPDGRLFASCYGSSAVMVWDAASQPPAGPLLTIRGPKVRGPAGIAFTCEPFAPRATLRAGSTPKEGAMQRAARAQCRTRVEAEEGAAALTGLGWDTEGGDRARVELLRAPAVLRARLGGEWRDLGGAPARVARTPTGALRFSLEVAGGARLRWEVSAGAAGIAMRFAASGAGWSSVEALELVLPFDPTSAVTCVLASEWDGGPRLPFILSAPDLGQMLVTCSPDPRLPARFTGSRVERRADLALRIPLAGGHGATVRFRPVRLAPPRGVRDTARWRDARRGWFDFLQLSAERPQEGSHAATPGGLWSNNALSDPVSSTLFWLGDAALLLPDLAPGVSVPPMLRRTLDFWLDHKVNAEGCLSYVVSYAQEMMDANPAALIAAWCYVEASGDLAWLRRRVARLEELSRYTERRDVDGDGLVESKQSGNRGTHAFGDTAWDTYSSGHKNAYVNALAYRAWRCMADLERRLGRATEAERFDGLADRLREAFLPTFHNPETGWLGWWRSADGMLHDVWSDVPTSLAILCRLIPPDVGARMLDRHWEALERTGFRRFDLGIPLNLRPVHRDDQFEGWGGKAEDGSDTFGKYLNGGCCVSNAGVWLAASYAAGRTERADRVMDAMLGRQRDGVFPNGGGFQNGFVDRYPEGAEFYDWSGATCGYEGHLVYSWVFLHALAQRAPAVRERLYGVCDGPLRRAPRGTRSK